MINNYRTAFDNKSTNQALEYNVDKIVNLTSLKLKELINKKQDKIREGNQLKAQKSVIESDIVYYEKEAKEKAEQINNLTEEMIRTEAEIADLEREYAVCLDEYNNQCTNFKITVNNVNDDLEAMTITSGVEETNKKSDTRLEYESYLKIKNENKLLMEKMYELRRNLYNLEVNKIFLIHNFIDKLQKSCG